MIIVNQNRDKIINFNNVKSITTGCFGNTVYANFIYDNMEELGYYGTEEKAKEIIQEIIEALEGNYNIIQDDKKIVLEGRSRGVYKMPQYTNNTDLDELPF